MFSPGEGVQGSVETGVCLGMYTSATYEPAVTSLGNFATQECSIGFPRLPGVSLWYFSKEELNYFSKTTGETQQPA